MFSRLVKILKSRRSDREISEWPDLLHLYSRLKPGITVYEWMQEYDTQKHGIDPRRFVSFGVIKVLFSAPKVD